MVISNDLNTSCLNCSHLKRDESGMNKINTIKLGDSEIRKLLIQHLENAPITPKAIIEELRVHNGNAIADVVSVHSYAHCYEIKSDKDNVERALKQSKFYDLTFKKVTLVTTEKHIKKAKELVPPYWGLMVAKAGNGTDALSYIRPATNTPSFDKQLALLTLWKSELLQVAQNFTEKNMTKSSRKMLSELIAEKLGSAQLARYIGNQLIDRKLNSDSLDTYKSYAH